MRCDVIGCVYDAPFVVLFFSCSLLFIAVHCCSDIGVYPGLHRVWRYRVFPSRADADDGKLPQQLGKLCFAELCLLSSRVTLRVVYFVSFVI